MISELADIESALSDSPGADVAKRIRGVPVSSHSAAVSAGGIFVAVCGERVNGHDFIEDAAARGAFCAVVEDINSEVNLLQERVPNARVALSRLVSLAHGSPSDELFCVAITGTNGKTTTNWMITYLLAALGYPALRIGTLGSILPDGKILGESLTTPAAEELYAALAVARDTGCSAVVMEASSHALAQSRLDDVALNVAVFTNLTRDHIDYHKTFENYAAAKERLFHLLGSSDKPTRRAVLNVDDVHGVRLAALCAQLNIPLVTFGRSADAQLRLLSAQCSPSGSLVSIEWNGVMYDIPSPYIGEHNAENLLAAIAAVTLLEPDVSALLPAITSLTQVPGRLEAVGDVELPIYVDYAHTPDALEHALSALRPLVHGRLWVVFGCGGDRDRGKRPLMGEVAFRLADEIVVTSDNPRTENPDSIIDQILAGNPAPRMRDADRRRAIVFAVRSASSGDAILIAGKGHEPYQVIGTEKFVFSDAVEAKQALVNRRSGEATCSTFSG